MFARYTEAAQRSIVEAQQEARVLQYDFVGTGHLLLGLLRQEGGMAVAALRAAGVDLELLRLNTVRLLGRGQGAVRGEIGFTAGAKRVMVEWSTEAARRLGHNYVGTEHLLLGLTQDEAHAGEALRQAGVTRDRLEAVLRTAVLPGQPEEPGHRALMPVPYSQALLAALRSAANEARATGAAEVLPEHLLMALLTVPEETSVRTLLLRHGLTLEELRRHLAGEG